MVFQLLLSISCKIEVISYNRMERELSEILGNRKVDLRTPQELSKYFRDEVLAQAEVQYAAT